MDSELEMAGRERGLRAGCGWRSPGSCSPEEFSGCPQAQIYGSQFHLATEAPELRVLLFWGQCLTFQSSKAFPA